MKRPGRFAYLFAIVFAVAAAALAPLTGGNLGLSWRTIDGGGIDRKGG